MTSFSSHRNAAIKDTVARLQQPIGKDQLIISAVSSMQDIDSVVNLLGRRLRVWYELYAPEVSYHIEDHIMFANLVLTEEKKDLLAKVKAIDTGGVLEHPDIVAIHTLAEQVLALVEEKNKLLAYIQVLMSDYMPNVLALATAGIAAKLLMHAGSLQRLARLPGSAIQLLGAEKALFKHIHTKAKPPKHGLLIGHQLMTRTKNKGKLARTLGNKIAIAARTDYYGGKSTIGAQLLKDLEEIYV